MLYTSKAIVLKKLKYSDNSFIVHMFVRETGHQTFMASKGRGKNTKASALFFPLSIVEISVQHKLSKSIQNIQSITLHTPFQTILFNPQKSAIAQFLAEIFYECIKTEVQHKTLFDYITTSIEILDLIEHNTSIYHIKTLLDLSKQMGFYPTNNHSILHPYFDVTDGIFKQSQSDNCCSSNLSAQIAEILTISNIEEHTPLLKYDIQNLLDILMSYYTVHVSNFKIPKSLEIFRMLI